MRSREVQIQAHCQNQTSPARRPTDSCVLMANIPAQALTPRHRGNTSLAPRPGPSQAQGPQEGLTAVARAATAGCEMAASLGTATAWDIPAGSSKAQMPAGPGPHWYNRAAHRFRPWAQHPQVNILLAPQRASTGQYRCCTCHSLTVLCLSLHLPARTADLGLNPQTTDMKVSMHASVLPKQPKHASLIQSVFAHVCCSVVQEQQVRVSENSSVASLGEGLLLRRSPESSANTKA